jgi:hypothetical protein
MCDQNSCGHKWDKTSQRHYFRKGLHAPLPQKKPFSYK